MKTELNPEIKYVSNTIVQKVINQNSLFNIFHLVVAVVISEQWKISKIWSQNLKQAF